MAICAYTESRPTSATRRNILAALAVAPAAIAAPALASVTNGDAAIIAAWEQHKAASIAYNALPCSDVPGVDYTQDERALIAIIDKMEERICSAVAKTPRGAEIQLWIALQHSLNSPAEDEAARVGDLAYFDQHDREIDWIDRLIVSAIRSLRSMQA